MNQPQQRRPDRLAGRPTRTYRVVHRTSYSYGATMTDGYSLACLAPRATHDQEVRASVIAVEPRASEDDTIVDAFGNTLHQFGLHEPHHTMSVTSTSEISVATREPPDDPTAWEEVVDTCASARGELALDVGMFRSSCALVDVDVVAEGLAPLIATVATPERGIVDLATALCEALHRTFEFDPHFSNVSTPLTDVLSARRGVCQDFAHVAVGCLRSLGLAARYVSGYIETVPPPGQERLVGADASHAWASVWTPLAGWVDFDPTNGHLPVNDHITVAWGRDYADVIPVRGVMIGPAAEQELHVAVDVVRI